MRSLLAAFMLVSVSTAAFGQAVTIEADVDAVNVEVRSVTVTYKAALGTSSATLDISRRAAITINGESATLEGLKKGHRVSLTYDKALAVVSSIDATGTPTVTELVSVPELDGSYPSLTKDGQTVVWEATEGRGIWTATRESADGYFTEKKSLFPGRHPAISSDGLEIIFIQKAAGKELYTLHVTSRQSLDVPFRRAAEITELSGFEDAKSPFISANGMVLCFSTGGKEAVPLYATRSNRSSTWSNPKPLISPAVQRSLDGVLTWFSLTDDNSKLICTIELGGERENNVLVFTRKPNETTFSTFREVTDEAVPPLMRSPRYVESTGELFFTGHPRLEPRIGIGIIKNFSFPTE